MALRGAIDPIAVFHGDPETGLHHGPMSQCDDPRCIHVFKSLQERYSSYRIAEREAHDAEIERLRTRYLETRAPADRRAYRLARGWDPDYPYDDGYPNWAAWEDDNE